MRFVDRLVEGWLSVSVFPIAHYPPLYSVFATQTSQILRVR